MKEPQGAPYLLPILLPECVKKDALLYLTLLDS